MRKPRTTADGSTVWDVEYRRVVGKRVQSKTFSEEGDAHRWAALVNQAGVEVALRVLETPDSLGARTLRQQVEHHIDHLTGVTDGTREDYRRHAARNIYPTLADVPINALTRDDIAKWINGLQRQGLSPKTIKNRHALLSGVLTDALREELVASNVAKGVRLPRVATSEQCFLTPQDFAELLGHVPQRWRPLVMLLAGTGMRWGEATALQVADVDLDARTIRISKAWKHSRTGHELGLTKTVRSDRTVALPAACRADLEVLTRGRAPGDWLFTNRLDGPVRRSAFHGDVWTPAVRAFAGDTRVVLREPGKRARKVWERTGTGKRPRIHDLRHSFASWAIAAGHSLTAVQRTMGHESITTTSDVYGHLVRADRDAFAELLPAAPGRQELPPGPSCA